MNNGPSAFSQATLEVRCPLRAQGHPLLYPVEVVTEGPLSCSSKHLNTLKLKVRTLRRASEIWSVCRDPPVNVTVDVFNLQLRPAAADDPMLVKSRREHQIHRRELHAEILAEHGNLVRSFAALRAGRLLDAGVMNLHQNRAIVSEAAVSSQHAKD